MPDEVSNPFSIRPGGLNGLYKCMLTVCIDYGKSRSRCLSQFTESGHTFLCSTLLCRTTWCLLGSTSYCPFVRRLISNWNWNITARLTLFFLNLKYTSTATWPCWFIPFLSDNVVPPVDSLRFLGWMRENLWTNWRRHLWTLPTGWKWGQDSRYVRRAKINFLWMTKRALCVSWY